MRGTGREAVRCPRGAVLLLAVLAMGCSFGDTPRRAAAPDAPSAQARPPAPVPDPRRSGTLDMSPATQAMQRDDSANPAMLAVLGGRQRWRAVQGAGARSCADCHGEPESMRGVAARYPAWDEPARGPFTLAQRINACRSRHQGLPAWRPDEEALLSLSALVGLQSRGLPIRPDTDPRLAAPRERGRERYERRIGQLNFACADCHDRLAGRRLGAATIPQAHPTGYPIYRLEWQSIGSLQRRLRNCMTGVRAEPFALDSPELVELELYLMQRAAGMAVETPAVRP